MVFSQRRYVKYVHRRYTGTRIDCKDRAPFDKTVLPLFRYDGHTVSSRYQANAFSGFEPELLAKLFGDY